jgi:hypothetical protein
MRAISLAAVNVTAIRRVAGRLRIGQLGEAWMSQTAIAFEDLPLGADDRPRGNGGEFVVAVGFVEFSKRNLGAAQVIQTAE